LNQRIHKNIHDVYEIETRRNSSRQSTALEVAIIFISLVKTIFLITGCVNQCPIHHFKSIESINS
jgi:uncharacterized Rmd1/YagE family protein